MTDEEPETAAGIRGSICRQAQASEEPLRCEDFGFGDQKGARLWEDAAEKRGRCGSEDSRPLKQGRNSEGAGGSGNEQDET